MDNIPGHYEDATDCIPVAIALSRPELVDDLFRCISLSWPSVPPFYEIITGIVLGGQVNSAKRGPSPAVIYPYTAIRRGLVPPVLPAYWSASLVLPKSDLEP